MRARTWNRILVLLVSVFFLIALGCRSPMVNEQEEQPPPQKGAGEQKQAVSSDSAAK
ncbi:MAG: hypothetical protein ACYTHM_04530 [Planctomycetota bacterium]|jgi:hypothetical protein